LGLGPSQRETDCPLSADGLACLGDLAQGVGVGLARWPRPQAVPTSGLLPQGSANAARSDTSSACGASTMAGPYQVRNRPLTRAQRPPGNDSGPSVSVNW